MTTFAALKAQLCAESSVKHDVILGRTAALHDLGIVAPVFVFLLRIPGLRELAERTGLRWASGLPKSRGFAIGNLLA